MSGNTTQFLSAYLLVGEDELKRRTVLGRLRARIAELGDLEFNHDVLDGETATGEAIVQACNTLPFASELRLVEVAHADKLAKQDSERIVGYLADPSASSVLALSAAKLAKNTRLYKAVAAIGKQAVIDCAPMSRRELISALGPMARERGFELDFSGATALVEYVGEDTVRLDSELGKLALAWEGPAPFGERDVRALVTRTTEAKPWELADALSQRDGARCIALLHLLGSSSPYALMGICSVRLRELACAKALAARGESSRLAEVLKVPPWRVRNHTRWASQFTEAELKRAFSTARDCERAMKSGADPDASFQNWLLATATR